MTLTLAPDPNPRRLDRAPQAKRHVGPYYGPSALRAILAERPPTVTDRLRDSRALWLTLIVAVIAAISFAVVVTL